MLNAVALSDKGKVRRLNQDMVYMSAGKIGVLPDLFLLADGMGGHQAGDYCSRTLIEKIADRVGKSGTGEHVAVLRKAIESANEELYRESLSNPELAGMGSTLVAAFIEKSTLYVFNVGDSRLYVAGHKFQQITRDHSFVEEMVDAGRMKRGSSAYNNNKNIITRAVGIGMNVDIDIFEMHLKKSDVVMLCSDGLTNMLSDEEIDSVISGSESLKDAAEKLISDANEKGGTDNISVILIASPGREEAS